MHLLLCIIFILTQAPIDKHLVTSLPGFGDLQNFKSKIYSGMLPSNDAETHLQHYFFVECETDPRSKPVVVWNQGGPGGPSLYGAFVELGPFLVNDNSLPPGATVPQLQYNEYGWQKVANVLFVDSPAPVGYSECSDNCGTASNPWNDTMYGVENGNFLNNFFDGFPEFRQNDLYLTGESYAGVYIPETVKYILANPDLNLNLKGFAIGNGCMGTDAGICVPDDNSGNPGMIYHVQYMYERNQVSPNTYRRVMEICGKEALTDGSYRFDKTCTLALSEFDDEIGGYFVYNLYDTCSGDNDNLDNFLQWKPRGYGAALNDYVCGGARVFDVYTNLTEVATQLHVGQGDFFWGIDNGWPGYIFSEKDLRPWYKKVLPTTGLKVLIFSGDVDAAVFTSWTLDWVDGLNLQTSSGWRPWTLNGQQETAGHVQEYRMDSGKTFTLATIRGAGHMVPLNKPEAALLMLSNWLNGEEFPDYVPPVTS